MKNHRTLFGWLIAILLLHTGCKRDSPSCEKLFERINTCTRSALDRETFLKRCSEEQSTHPGEIACSTRKDCKAFEECVEQAKKAELLGKAQTQLNAAIERKDWLDALLLCDIHQAHNSLASTCKGIVEPAWDSFFKKALESRNLESGTVLDPVLCAHLRLLGEKLGKEEESSRICREIELAVHFQKAISEVQKHISQKRDALPFACLETSLGIFNSLDTPFARERRDTLMDACYVQLGKTVLARQLPDMKDHCRHSVKEIFHFAKKHGLSDPELDLLIAQAAPLCEKDEK